MTKTMTTSEQKVASARGMFEAMRHQRDKAQAGLDAAQAEIRRQRDRADRAERDLDSTNAIIEGVVQALTEAPDECDPDSVVAALSRRLLIASIRSEATA